MTPRKLFVLSLLFAAAVVFTVHSVDFPGSVPNFVRVSGGGMLLDVRPAFSEEAIYQRLSDYGEAGRNNYRFRNLTVDILLPLAVFPALFLAMQRAADAAALGRASRTLFLSFAFIYVIFDLAENGTVLALLADFPARKPLLAGVLPYLTVTKRTASLLALGAPLAAFFLSRIRRRVDA